MPRSRSSRSASPLTQRSQESLITNDREQIFQQVKEIFQSTLDDVIVRMVLIECNWRDEIAIDKLLAIAEDAEAQNLYKQNESKLRQIAEGVLGPISFEDYKRHGSVRGPPIPDSKLSASARIIGRPVKHEDQTRQSYSTPNEPQGSLVARGSNYLHPHVIPKSDVGDVDFPKLPSKLTAPSNAFSSESSHSQQASKYSGTLFQDSSIISQAQSAYNQQFDDAASAQRWEEVKEKLSEHYVGNLGQSQTDKSRAKTGRNFPVRLLNKDNDKEGAEERARKLSRLDSADLDESILRGIYEVSSDPIEEVPAIDKKSGSGTGTPRSATPGHGTPSPANVPMTLPVIGLSVEAVEFVPRSKPSKVDSDKSGGTEPSLSSPKSVTSKTSQSNPIEIKSGARNIKSTHSPGVQFGSPASPTVSPGVGQHLQGRTTPVSSVSSSHLTGSPVFMTYKWPQGLHCVTATPSHQSPILTGPRYIARPPPPPRLTHATAFRLHGAPTPMSYQAGQVVYPMTQPPFFQIPGVSPHQMAQMGAQHVHMPRLATDLEERAAIATGSPIMANVVGEPQRTVTKTTGKGGKLINPAWISQWTQKIKDKQTAGKKVLVIVRGLPGSGKSILSRSIQMDGVVLSTDDFFTKGGFYTYNPDKLSESHQWNRERAKEAIKLGTSPIIIDNTNTQKWEFSSYVNMAISNNYHVEIIEPETPWKFKPTELAKRTVHGVPKEHIQRMMSRYEHNITVDMIIGKGKFNNAADKKSQTKKAIGEAVDADISAVNEDISDNVKQKDNRSWDLNEEKAAHLSRHLDNSSRSSTPDALADSLLSQASPVHGVHNRSQSPSSTVDHAELPDVDDAISSSRTGPKTKNPDPHQNEILRDQTIMTESSNSQPHVKNEPPPSLKFEKTSHILKMNKSVLHQNIAIKGRQSPTTSDIHENKMSSVKSKLSADTLKEIDDMLEVYMTDTNLSKDELHKREEELGALLQLLPINAEEMNAAETLIHLRLHKSCVQGEDEDGGTEFVEDETEVRIKLSDNDKSHDGKVGHSDDVDQVQNVVPPACKVDNKSFAESEGIEVVEKIASSVVVEKNAVSDTQIDEQELFMESMIHGVKDLEVKGDRGDDLLDQSVVSDIPKAELLTESQKKEAIVEETDILNETNHDYDNVSVNSQTNTDNKDKNLDENKHEDCSPVPEDNADSVNNIPVFQELSDIEIQYWNKLNKKVEEHPEVVDTKWNDPEIADDWVEHQEAHYLESPVVKLVKPQRERKQKNKIKKNANDENQTSVLEDNGIKSCHDDIVTVSNQSQQNQNVDISENSVNINCSNSDNFDEVNFEANDNVEVTGSKIFIKEENDNSECEDALLKQTVDNNCVKDATEVSNADTVGQEDITVFPQTDHAYLNSCENASCSYTKSAITESISLPSVHNSSLDLLKEGYADMDFAEEDPVPTQCDTHGTQISLKPDPVLNITPQNTETTLGVDVDACIALPDTGTGALGASLVIAKHSTEAANSVEVLDKQTKDSGDSLLVADKPSLEVGDSIEVLNKHITDSGDSILAMGKHATETCDSIEVLDKHVTKTGDSAEVLNKHTTQNSGKRNRTDKISQSPILKKHTQRKMAAVFPKPLLTKEETLLTKEEKQKLLTKDWTTLNVTPKSPILNNTQPQNTESPELIDIGTMTCDEDFRNSDNLSRGFFVDSSVKYLIGTSKKIININHTSSTESPVIPKVYLIDKSTSIDDLKDMWYSESVKFLKTCFPNVREDELECVLVNCHDNVEWAINLLLDWKYSMHLSEEEKQGFEEGIEKVKKANEPVRQPSSLTDLCFELIEQKSIASRDELESQLIETSKGRLDRIEDDNISKIRLHRSTSLNESTDESRDSLSSTTKWSPSDVKEYSSSPDHSDKKCSVGFKRSDNQKMIDTVKENADETDESCKEDRAVYNQINEPCDQDSNNEDDSIFVENGLDSNDSVVDIESRIYVKDKQLERIRNKVEMKEFGRFNNHTNETWFKGGDGEEFKQDEDGFNDEGYGGTPALTINLPRDSVLQLQKMFGQIGLETDASDMLVPLDHGTALKLYQCIKHGVKYKKQLQLQKDEEMARALQEHEDSFASNQRADNPRSKINARQRKYVPLDDRLAAIQPQEASSAGPISLPPIKSFESIMQEEEEKQKKKEEFQKMLVTEGGPSSMSTRVKRSQLYEKFPTVDRSAIDRCFEANCFNMTETEEAIRWALGHPEERSLNQVRDQEAPLIESTKQQSIQEMLDSYLYKPRVTKDYQDGAYPNYEDYRGEANLHIRMRHECFQKAQAAFRQGLKQVASFYSQQGHLHTQKIKEANMRASEQILADRNGDLNKGVLDLHGLHIDEAIAALNRTLPDLEQDRSKKHICIITGRGSHSRGGIARLRPSVIAYLKRFRYTFVEEQTGVLKVTLKYRR